MIDDFRLRVFDTVCRAGSFTAAARELGITQPAVSQQIAELEKDMGRALFERKPASVALSEEGRRFQEYAAQILHWYDAANQAFREDAPKAVELELESGRVIQLWTCGDDVHLKLKSD